MPNKVNAPAVSQLAGEIAAKIINRFPSGDMRMGGTFARSEITAIISAALSEREKKNKRVELAAWNLLSVLPKSSALVERVGKFSAELEAALSALGESK